jgi:hypothetical protein
MSIDLVDNSNYVCPTLKESVIHQLVSAGDGIIVAIFM